MLKLYEVALILCHHLVFMVINPLRTVTSASRHEVILDTGATP